MEAWAQTMHEIQTEASSINIRPSVAVAALRRQWCFADATNYDIRRAVMKYAKKVNAGFIRGDDPRKTVCKYGLWPPLSRHQFEKQAPTYGFGPTQESTRTNRDDRSRWILFDISGTDIILKPGLDGLPDRERYFSEFWARMICHLREVDRPLPPYPWARLRLRLLSPDRLGKAAANLPFRCPLCLTNSQSAGDRPTCGEWFLSIPGDEDMLRDQVFCWECSNLARDRRGCVKRKRERADRISVPSRISPAVAERALRELGVFAPKREAAQVLHQILNQPEKEIADA